MSAHELDHVAFAVPSWASAGPAVHQKLGARWVSGFDQGVFSPCQLALADDMRIELLAPAKDGAGFIAEFLAKNEGKPKAHHITFKVKDIQAGIAAAQAAGIRPILENTDHELWKEVFLHPKDTGLGFLVQLVETPLELDGNDEFSMGDQNSVPWKESEIPAVRMDFIYGRINDVSLATRALGQVLGAKITELPGAMQCLKFSWDHGAELVLDVSDEHVRPSLDVLVVSPADQLPAPELDARLLESLRTACGTVPELGIGLLELQAAY